MKALFLSFFFVNVAYSANLPKEYMNPGFYSNMSKISQKKSKIKMSKFQKNKKEDTFSEDPIALGFSLNEPKVEWIAESPQAYIQAERFVRTKNPELTAAETDEIINSIFSTAHKYNLDPKLMLSIIAVESMFDPDSVSSTGDYSIAQINYNVWRVELIRVYNERLSLQRLKTDIPYSIDIMGKILSYIHKNHSRRDQLWFARYHSTTRRYKKAYAGRLKRNIPKGNLTLAFAD